MLKGIYLDYIGTLTKKNTQRAQLQKSNKPFIV